MKSSKMENIFNCCPPVEEDKAIPPFVYYQPFRSGFDSELSVNAGKNPKREVPPHVKRWWRGASEKPGGHLRMSGGSNLTPQGPSFSGPSTSTWGETEGRSLCNSTWRGRPSISESPKQSMTVSGGSGAQFPPKGGGGIGDFYRPGLGGLDGASFRVGSSLCQSGGEATNLERNLTSSTYYPLPMNPLGRNTSQNLYKTGHTRPMMCNFCKNNKEVPDIYLNHYLYDPATKVLSCPVLRKHVCEVCGGTGDQAHTLQYCPVNKERGLQSKFPVLLKTRTITNSTGKIRRN